MTLQVLDQKTLMSVTIFMTLKSKFVQGFRQENCDEKHQQGNIEEPREELQEVQFQGQLLLIYPRTNSMHLETTSKPFGSMGLQTPTPLSW